MFHHIKKSLICIIVVLSGFAAACNSTSTPRNGPDDVVAKVGSKEIKLGEVDRVIKQNLDQSQGAAFTAAELANARLAVLEDLIQKEAVFQRAKKDNLVPDDAKVAQEVQKRKSDAGLTEDQYQAQLKQAGLSEDEYKDNIRRELAYNALQDKEKSRVTQPTDEEVRKYFQDHKEGFKVRRGADISIIVTAPQGNGGDVAAEQKIKAIYEQLKSGTDFATIAAQRSEDASNIRGGAIGFVAEDQIKQNFGPKVADDIMTKLTPGKYTEPQNIGGRWVIVKLNNRYEKEENLTLDNPEVRKSIVDTLTQQRQSVLLNSLVTLAISEASPKNYLVEQLVEDPKRISEMKPSALLQQALEQPQQAQPQPRVENQNATASRNTNTAPAANANTPAARANGNARPAAGNTNK